MKKIFSLIILLVVVFLSKAQEVKPSTGTIKSFNNFQSKYIAARNVDVWLPEGYSPKRKYAVLYMQDGQMLFDSSNNWIHQEWGVDETIGKLISENKIKQCIVVGIWNTGLYRHADYMPQKPFESLTKQQQDSIYAAKRVTGESIYNGATVHSDNYLKFLVKELKPFIDSAFSTMKNRENTFIAGSSMGGLISLYAICEYPKIFGGAACLSTHWPGIFTHINNPIPGSILKYLKTHLPDPKNHKIYFDYGTLGLDTMYKPYQLQVDKLMRSKGYYIKNWVTKEFPEEGHIERSWAKRLDIPVTFLLKKISGK
ncbi:alpha/beta hydrolase [Ferruginibacter sp. SUN002]|uniref:alpha/beta hydrolase n=1 Tax=Ferruginibacter sp. SUN002 TaxID=2937789 RepID=UPI003D35A55B